MLTRRFLGLALMATATMAGRRAEAQEALTAGDQYRAEGRYLPLYLELKAQVEAGDENARFHLPWFAAFVGDEATAVGFDERTRSADRPIPDLADAEAEDALEAIVRAAADKQIVILNEAHNVSGHRGFAARVMRALRPLGFDTFAAETFGKIDAYRTGAPFHQGLGYYIADPVYAETVREAAGLGYVFADYEQRPDQRAPAEADMDARTTAREIAQARNLIENVLKPRPDARIFVLCGYSHATEVEGVGGLWFAGQLKAATGIDPLTIEQSNNWPATRPEADTVEVAAVLKRYAPTRPVTVSRDGRAFASRFFDGKVDLSVFHPRLPKVAGRPGWLAADPVRKPVEVPVPPFEGPALLQALHLDEGLGIPADHLLLEPAQTRATLLLRPGRYFLRLETTDGIEPAFGMVTV
ncbi:MAG: hypothetical protein Q7J26_12225 [Brevundimonas sp.]|uniref:hypothetical protein n=1 Tax=Brevundimonas sp. TaxID=1871086 RepID=UPI0027233AD7|nr:hypothetical protein [Brevundimonas sp.]MDO9609283.1 hypothetical protein [Brevundimonas sp.]